MKFRKKPILLAAIAMFGGHMPCGIATAKIPSQIIVTPQSPDAAIVLDTDWWQPAPSMDSAFKLIFSTYASENGKLTSDLFSGNVLIEAKKKNFAEGYLIATIKPGKWVLQAYSQQDNWALCFNASSLQFDVKPGEVLYLGKFDAPYHRRQLLAEAVKSGRTSTRHPVDFFDLSSGPRFDAVDEAGITAVKAVLSRRAPGVTAPVHAATFSPASFGTGFTMIGGRRCGGYFKTSAKSQKPAN